MVGGGHLMGVWAWLLFLSQGVSTATPIINVLLPELCSPALQINLTWIREIVLLGLDSPQLPLNIVPQAELCSTTTSPLLNLISIVSGGGEILASLGGPLCAPAGAFLYSQGSHFTSWTCPRMNGILSLQPNLSELIHPIKGFLNHFRWSKVIFTKMVEDKGGYCDEIELLLGGPKGYHGHPLLLFIHYQHLIQPQYASLLHGAQGVLLCVSYEYGVSLSREEWVDYPHPLPIPLVLLPQWPLPLQPIPAQYALLSSPQWGKASGEMGEDADGAHGWDTYGQFLPFHNNSDNKLMDAMLSRVILQSIRLLKGDHPQSFRYSLFKWSGARWDPLLDLGDRGGGSSHWAVVLAPPTTPTNPHQGGGVGWSGVGLGGLLSLAVLLFLLIFFSRGKGWSSRPRWRMGVGEGPNNRTQNIASLGKRELGQRGRVIGGGPYKLLLTSRDISFNTGGVGGDPDHSIEISSSPPPSPSGHGVGGPNLIRGSFGARRKGGGRGSFTTMNTESIILHENQGKYKGDLVHLRPLPVPLSSPFAMKGKAMRVIETVHGLRHENLVALIGVLGEGELPSLVWESCSRGSLAHVLKQQHIKLDWPFKLSLLTDLVRGMKYLHSSLVRVHGWLTSNNCVIDARWVLKITDYGLLSFYHNQGLPLPTRSHKELLWTAPELLREESLRRHGTQPGDVYSFGIIMSEVFLRSEPYSMLPLSPQEIVEKVQGPGPPFLRPSMSKGCSNIGGSAPAPPEALNLMRQCWSESPSLRPPFPSIHDQFRSLNQGRKANIVDTMFELLEKYSNNLEDLIKERTEELDLEKKKTEQLLNRMLPSMVADKLKLGLPVDPEEFQEVTIYFSDIVGFTTISAYSTPFEVVDLLNDLYSCFDLIINDYNVYKVETIGDAYMVVSGAPLKSRDHAPDIATMALDLLHESGKFRIHHLPFTPLQLRIGIHTGPCCAGVVGLTMPRYCFFGDTVNTASRMESTGAPWRIHISAQTKTKLEEIGGYRMEYRGLTEVKGKGALPTYWLLGKEGFHKVLPTPPPLNDSHGLDEKSIVYGRTGVVGATSPSSLYPTTTTTISKSPSLSNSLRSLNPAEEVAHQLLNGRPAARGLRRQFSLDQGGSGGAGCPLYRKTPSLEEPVISPATPLHHQLSLEAPSTSKKGVEHCGSPRLPRVFAKTSSLTIVEESPQQE